MSGPSKPPQSGRQPPYSSPSSGSGSNVEGLRQGAQAIGSGSADVSSVAIEMENLDISGTEGRPPEPLMTNERVIYTESIEEDMKELKDIGFIIDYPNSKLGSGLYGDVYKGIYGRNADKLKDAKGQPLRNVVPNMPFAVKLIDFQAMGQDSARIANISLQMKQKTRDSYETEKKIMTFADHPNITPIRMAVNMGRPGVYTNETTDMGSLYLFGRKAESLSSTDRVKLTQDLFSGLKYLHDNSISHGDIHAGNVLLFKDETGIVAKWTDFGMGYVGKVDKTNPDFIDQTLIVRKQTDCTKFYTILHFLWEGRQRDGEDEYTQQLCDQFLEFQRDLRKHKDLDFLLNKYQEILKWKDRLI